MTIESRLTQFLIVQASAGDTRHSGRTLLNHLVGTHNLLQRWGNSAVVCRAGLFHSIYGTNKFRTRSWPLTDRETIRNLIGPRAERLVYEFCTADRPAEFFNLIYRVAVDEFRDLMEIEAANLLEQGSRSKWLKRLRDSDISDAARRAIDEHHANLSGRPQQVVQQTTTDHQ